MSSSLKIRTPSEIPQLNHWSSSLWCFVQVLGESMAGISQNCKTGDVPAFGDCVGSASKALCGLTEAAAQVQSGEAAVCMQVIVTYCCVCFSQASYLVGASDPNSQAGHQGLVDPIQFARANQAIQMACQNLVDPQSSPSQVHIYTCKSLNYQ